MYYQTKTATPCAFITKDKQRLKQFGHNVYLKNGEEFELELFNPSQSTVLAKIKINGNYLSGGGLVLKPGQRVFLERYLDDAKKFKFETYEVDGSHTEVLDAISSNGDVSIEFYEEQIYSQPIFLSNTSTNYSITHPYQPHYGNTFTTLGGNVIGGNVTYTSSSNNGFSSSNELEIKPINRSFAKKTKSIETGRVEKGGNSDQSFKTVSLNFNSWAVSKSVWKILPESVKPYEIKDLKVYCTECGVKRKKDSHKFCPTCGTKY
jgi:hypothetical protein